MSKVSDLSEDEKEKLTDNLESISKTYGMNAWKHTDRPEAHWLEEYVGICYNCKSLSYARLEFGGVLAYCYHYETRLEGKERVMDCSSHARRGVLKLSDMWEIATLIDPPKRKAGF